MNKINKNNIKFKKGLDSRIKNLILDILKHNQNERPSCSDILNNPNLISLLRQYNLIEQEKKPNFLESLKKLT